MNQQLMRQLDAWAGKLLCFLLTMHSRVFAKKQPNTPPTAILFIKLIEQGASVLAVNALARANALVGRDQVYICVFEENRPIIDLLELMPAANVWALRNKNLWVFAIDLFKMLRRARQVGISATVDLEFFSRGSAIIGYLTGARSRVGLHRFTMDGPYRGDLMTHRVAYNPYFHTAQTYRLMVEALTMDVADLPINKMPPLTDDTKPPTFVAGGDDVKFVEQLLQERYGGSLPPGPRLILNPNASDLMPLRKWPTERFLELARRLLVAHPQAVLILTGAPREAAVTERITRDLNSPRVLNVAGATSMRQLLTLFTRCDVLVTNDSGPAHFASMTAIQNIVLFGPETPSFTAPSMGTPIRSGHSLPVVPALTP